MAKAVAPNGVPNVPAASSRGRVVAFLAEVNATNARILFTLVMIGATAARFLWLGVPKDAAEHWTGWLVFLGALAGVDVAQYAFKRATYRPDAPDATAAPCARCDAAEAAPATPPPAAPPPAAPPALFPLPRRSPAAPPPLVADA